MLNIVGCVGIQDSPGMTPMWTHNGAALLQEFKGATFCAERYQYDFWQVWKMWKYRDYIVAKYDTGDDVLLDGHSMGAVIARAAASRFKKSKVVELISMNGAHTVLLGIFSILLGCKPIAAPILSISARYDEVMPGGTECPGAAMQITFPINHHRDLMKNFLGVAEEIAKAAKEVFEKARRE